MMDFSISGVEPPGSIIRVSSMERVGKKAVRG
jgi:hypothetical protein